MNWQDLTAPEFAKAVREVGGVCLLPVGVIEKHGEHLPLGTDLLAGIRIAELAAAIEPAIVFPPYYFGQIFEAMHQPGTIAINPRLMMELLENMCSEISRNGLKKIVIVSAHGGNGSFLPYFAQCTLSAPRDYALYVARLSDYYSVAHAAVHEQMTTAFDEHGGELETSLMLAVRPELVKMDAAQAFGAAPRQGRLSHLPPVYSAIGWYADFPDHYAGDARPARAELGQTMLQAAAEALAKIVKAVKADTAAPGLLAEFYSRTQH